MVNMRNLKDYIEEAISSGKHRSGGDYNSINKRISFNEFIDILNDLGYHYVVPRGAYINEQYAISTLIGLLEGCRNQKSYVIQDMKTVGYLRVVLYNGKHEEPFSVFKVEFQKKSPGTIDVGDIELYVNYGPSIRDAEDMDLKDLIEYIGNGEE